ncbi:MAG TPA: mevalonate kinase [Kiritimatiellia bacterium]|nr:mevalonate kinase [Kiritimatiellia bacterium]HRZ11343.1 mevalonate kinase [Kiritimatiellia bacterium]HSA17106.1 mevalonate kinase [Kiritimatiellia bacterium]
MLLQPCLVTASFQASAPGSLMLMGEHAVVHGRRALVAAVNRRIRVRLEPRGDGQVRIASALGEVEMPLGRLRSPAPFRFVMAMLRRYEARLPSGFDLNIESGFPSTVGLGSSAAVTVATCAALERWTRSRRPPPWDLFVASREVIREVQGLGSGADVAASVFGGILLYRAAPAQVQRLKRTIPLVVLYSGGKTPTPEVVRRVQRAMKAQPAFYGDIFDLMDRGCAAGFQALRAGALKRFGELLDIQQGLMEAIGVSNARMAELVYALRGERGILGSKISGSGLGDCVIGLGRSDRTDWPGPRIEAEISSEGVKVE